MKSKLIAHVLIHDDRGRVLIIRRAKDNDVLPSIWDIPGGSCEPGEDPLAAAIRETMEETALVVADPRLFAHTSNVDEEKDSQFVRLIFMAKYQGGEIHLNDREHEDFAWVDPRYPDQKPLVDYLPEVLRLFREINLPHA